MHGFRISVTKDDLNRRYMHSKHSVLNILKVFLSFYAFLQVLEAWSFYSVDGCMLFYFSRRCSHSQTN